MAARLLQLAIVVAAGAVLAAGCQPISTIERTDGTELRAEITRADATHLYVVALEGDGSETKIARSEVAEIDHAGLTPLIVTSSFAVASWSAMGAGFALLATARADETDTLPAVLLITTGGVVGTTTTILATFALVRYVIASNTTAPPDVAVAPITMPTAAGEPATGAALSVHW